MLRSLFVLLALGVVAASAQSAPAFPSPASASGNDGMCQLDGLTLTGGSIVGQFSPTTFDYQGTSDFSSAPRVSVHMIDAGSNAQVWFNGRPVHSANLGNALTNNKQQSDALFSGSNGWQTGQNLVQILVSCEAHAEGQEMCNYVYTITFNKPGTSTPPPPPASGGFVTGDPQFVGLRGQQYQVHGVSGEVYSIVSDADLQYNSRFVFLSSGKCPIVDGKKQKGCWSHPGSYLGELGLKTKAGERIQLLTGPADTGFASVSINDRQLAVGDTVLLQDGAGSVTLNSTHLASVQIGNWDFAFENSDRFVNQRVRVFDSRNLRSHGLLGQTWRAETYPNAVKYIQGSVDDYVIRDGQLFGDSFVFNAFN